MRRREFYIEEIDHRTSVSVHEPLTTRELVDSARLHVFQIFVFVLLLLVAMFVCIVTQGHVPLLWTLPGVAVVSLLCIHYLKL